MLKGDNGIWYYTVFGDIKNTYYTYIVTTDGKAQETCDIYAKAVGVMVIELWLLTSIRQTLTAGIRTSI